MPRPQPDREPDVIVQRVRLRYAKRGRLRFTSHRDFARAFERALRRARVPMAYSAGFTPHPKIAYGGAVPTGVASEAEYVEIGLVREVELEWLRSALDEALPPGIDIVAAAPAQGALAERLTASVWRIVLPGVSVELAQQAVARFMAQTEVVVERLTKSGKRQLNAREPILSAVVRGDDSEHAALSPSAASASSLVRGGEGASLPAAAEPCAILDIVARQVTPAVRPDDVLAGLRAVAELVPTAPPRVTRLAQGMVCGQGQLADPLVVDRVGGVTGDAEEIAVQR